MTACVVGLGLIGGSMARRLLAAGHTVIGFDRDADTVDAARALGIDARQSCEDLAQLSCDVVILAVPVLSIIPLLPQLADSDARLVIDVASTKRAVVEVADAVLPNRFVGCHPLAGSHESGFAAARADLFVSAPVFICPTAQTSPVALRAAQQFWHLFGARVELMDPEEHDRELAAASHLPQTLATVLANALHTAAIEPNRLGPGGRDMTRLAASDPRVWADILLTNRDNLRHNIADVVAGLEEVLTALDQHDGGRLTSVLAAGQRWAHGTKFDT